MVPKTKHLELVSHLGHPIELLGLLHVVRLHLNGRTLELLILYLDYGFCCGLEGVALDVHFCLDYY